MAAELGQTRDPKELIPGNPEAVRGAGDALVKAGDRLEDVAHDLGRVETPGWTGDASTAFWDKFPDEKPKWLRGGDAMSAVAKALNGHADSLSWAQSQAKEAIDRWEQGEAATKQAVTQYNAAVAEANAQNLRNPNANVTVPPFSDPGEELRMEAQEILNRAREQLDGSGVCTAETIALYTGKESESPSWLVDAAEVADTAIEEDGLGNTTIGKDLANGDKSWRTWGEQGDDEKGSRPSWEVQLLEASEEASLWEVGVEGETQLAGATLEGMASLQTMGVDGSAGLSISGDGLKSQLATSVYLAKAAVEGSIRAGMLEMGGRLEGEVGANASGELNAGKEGVEYNAEAFVGAKGELDAHADLNGVEAGVHGEGGAGLGFRADGDIGWDDGKLTISGKYAAYLGLGGGGGYQLTVDPGEVKDTVEEVGESYKESLFHWATGGRFG